MTYPGGKNGAGVYQTIINQMPPHKVYIEPFLGGGAVMRYKKPARVNSGLDLDADALSAFEASVNIPGLFLHRYNALDYLSQKIYNASDTLIYLDPPYLMETRRSQRPLYTYEFSAEGQHARLLDIVTDLDCMVMISGYWSQLYADTLAGWRCVTFTAQTRGGETATEYLWINYPEPDALHDYQYLGDDYRERERIKRKIARWTKRLKRMDQLERRAIMAAIEGTAKSGDTAPPSHLAIPDRTVKNNDGAGGPAIFGDSCRQTSPKVAILQHDFWEYTSTTLRE